MRGGHLTEGAVSRFAAAKGAAVVHAWLICGGEACLVTVASLTCKSLGNLSALIGLRLCYNAGLVKATGRWGRAYRKSGRERE